MLSMESIEKLYAAHDELLSNPIRSGDRALASDESFRRLFRWQFTEYYRLLKKCMDLVGSDQPEFKQARSYLRKAEGSARGGANVRLATAQAEIAIQYIHRWLERVRRENRQVEN